MMPGGINNVPRLVPGLIEQIPPDQGKSSAKESIEGSTFSDLFSDLINSVNDLQKQAGGAQEALLAGEPIELHEVMIKAEQAGVATDLLLEIRNKLVSAYNEVMRMPM
jgi:flagellar hook-basal body complex protein FliE